MSKNFYMKFHKEGYASLFLVLLFSSLIVFIAHYFFSEYAIAKWFAYILSGFLLITILQFFRNPNVSRIAEKIAVILRSENISKLYDYDAVYGKKCCCSGCKDDKENDTYDEAAPVYYGSSFDLTPRCRFGRCKCGLMLSGLGSTTFCRACEF